MKVAFFNYLSLTYGGGLAQYYLTISEGLKARYPSFDYKIVSLDESSARHVMRMYSMFYFRNEEMRAAKKSTGLMAHTTSQLGEALKTFDVIYSKNDIFDLTLLKMAGLGRRLPPIIIGFHTPIHYAKTPTIQAKMHNILYSALYYRMLLNQASGFHVLNAFHEKKLRALFPRKSVAKIHNPVDIALYKTAAKKQPGVLKILWVGRLTKDKGCDDLMKLIKREWPRRIHWTVVGGGAMRADIANLAKSCNNVAYFERMDHKKLAQEYSRHDVFVSTSKWECLPYTVLESQFTGTPVIGYNIPGVSDIVIDNKTGTLVNNIDAMVNALEKFKATQFNNNKIRLVALQRFNPDDSYKKMYRFLQKSS